MLTLLLLINWVAILYVCESEGDWDIQWQFNYFPNDWSIGHVQGGYYNGVTYLIYGSQAMPPYDYYYNITKFNHDTGSLSTVKTTKYTTTQMDSSDVTHAVIGNKVYFWASGLGSGSNSPSWLSYNMDTNEFADIGGSSYFQYSCFTSFGTKIYQTGFRYTHSMKQFKVYDTVTEQWSSLRDMPTGRRNHGCQIYGDNLYVFGGLDPDTINDKYDIIKYSFPNDAWSTVSNDAFSDAYSSYNQMLTVVFNDEIVLVTCDNNNPRIFNPATGQIRISSNQLNGWTSYRGGLLFTLNNQIWLFSKKMYSIGTVVNPTTSPSVNPTKGPITSSTSSTSSSTNSGQVTSRTSSTSSQIVSTISSPAINAGLDTAITVAIVYNFFVFVAVF